MVDTQHEQKQFERFGHNVVNRVKIEKKKKQLDKDLKFEWDLKKQKV